MTHAPNHQMNGYQILAGKLHNSRLAYAHRIEQRSHAVPRALNRQINTIAAAWAAVFLLASLPKVLFSITPVYSLGDFLTLALPYLVIAAAPIAGYRIAAGSFPRGVLTAQPEIRLSIIGKWRSLNVLDAKANPLFGPAGFMASLLIGLLLNVVFRSFEFLVAVPALNGQAPLWGQSLFQLMAADVAVTSFFYMVCFVMALRTIPYFPRMLLFAWALDVCSQLAIAKQIGMIADLPASVAGPREHLLEGNIQKVLISAFVWLPYLILSDRVNITFRRRIRA